MYTPEIAYLQHASHTKPDTLPATKLLVQNTPALNAGPTTFN